MCDSQVIPTRKFQKTNYDTLDGGYCYAWTKTEITRNLASAVGDAIQCRHCKQDLMVKKSTGKSQAKNTGRLFISCPNEECKLFSWLDGSDWMCVHALRDAARGVVQTAHPNPPSPLRESDEMREIRAYVKQIKEDRAYIEEYKNIYNTTPKKRKRVIEEEEIEEESQLPPSTPPSEGWVPQTPPYSSVVEDCQTSKSVKKSKSKMQKK